MGEFPGTVDEKKAPNLGAAWKLFYGDGLTLGEIAEKLGCGIYDLSPWLTAPAIRSGLDGAEKWMERFEHARSEAATLRKTLESLERNLREQAVGEQCGVLLAWANEAAAALRD